MVGSGSRLGAANLALVSIYLSQAWGRDALRGLLSRYQGLDDAVLQASAAWVRRPFDLTSEGIGATAMLLSSLKLVMAAGFLAYAIEFARATLLQRPIDRGTTDLALWLSLTGLMLWSLPALELPNLQLVRLHATQTLLVIGAMIVIVVERQIEEGSRLRESGASQALPFGNPQHG